jgi:hypothetical protein
MAALKGKGKGKKGASQPDVPEPMPSAGGASYDKRKMGTLDAFAKSAMLPTRILMSQTAKDRPDLAAKLCRLISLLCDQQIKFSATANARARERSLVTIIHRAPTTSSLPKAPFAVLEKVIQAVNKCLRLHANNVQCLTAALETLDDLRSVALESAPAGATPRGKKVEIAWQKLLAGQSQKGELRKGVKIIQEALHDTEVADNSMRISNAQPSDLTGDCTYLTPRIKEQAKKSVDAGLRLASDVLAVAWEEGEPGKEAKITKQKASITAAIKAKEDAILAEAKATAAQAAFDASSQISGATDSDEDGTSKKQKGKGKGKKGKGKGKGKGKKKGKGKGGEDEEDADRGLEEEEEETWSHPGAWTRALGFGVHDEEDFNRLYRGPLTNLLRRSFSDTSLERPAQPPGSAPAALETGKPAVVMPPTLASIAGLASMVKMAVKPSSPGVEEDLELEFVESVPGKLKVRCVVPCRNKIKMNVYERRLNQLLDPEQASRAMTQELAKQMRKQGCLLPKYGMQVTVRKGRKNVPDLSASAGALPAAEEGVKLPPI